MKKFILFFKETKVRILSKTPQYFKTWKYCCAALATTGTYLKSNSIDFEIYKISVVTLLIGAGAIGALLTSLPVSSCDQPKLDQLQNSANSTTSN